MAGASDLATSSRVALMALSSSCWSGFHHHATRKCFLCDKTDLVTLLNHSFACFVQFSRKSGLMHLEVEALKALNSCHEL